MIIKTLQGFMVDTSKPRTARVGGREVVYYDQLPSQDNGAPPAAKRQAPVERQASGVTRSRRYPARRRPVSPPFDADTDLSRRILELWDTGLHNFAAISRKVKASGAYVAKVVRTRHPNAEGAGIGNPRRGSNIAIEVRAMVADKLQNTELPFADIARAVGVSPSTVGRINAEGKYRETTRFVGKAGNLDGYQKRRIRRMAASGTDSHGMATALGIPMSLVNEYLGVLD